MHSNMVQLFQREIEVTSCPSLYSGSSDLKQSTKEKESNQMA